MQHELNCRDCFDNDGPDGDVSGRDCRRCFFSQVPALHDRFFQTAVQPYCYVAATLLFLSYIIGLWFTLRTHAAVIWNNEIDEKKAHVGESQLLPPARPAPPVHSRLQRQGTSIGSEPEVRNSHLYKKILGQSLKQIGLSSRVEDGGSQFSPNSRPAYSGLSNTGQPAAHLVPPKSANSEHHHSHVHIPGFSEAENDNLVREVAELAATAATLAAHSTARSLRNASVGSQLHSHGQNQHQHQPSGTRPVVIPGAEAEPGVGEAAGGGHDAPNWSRVKSSIILLGATVLYAMIAEILVNTVDVILKGVAIDEKFVGITLFALVPNTTEFLVSYLCHNIKKTR